MVMISINLCCLVRKGSGVFYLGKVVSNGNFWLKLDRAWSSYLFPFQEEYLFYNTTSVLSIN